MNNMEINDFNEKQLDFAIEYNLAELYNKQEYEQIEKHIQLAVKYDFNAFKYPKEIAESLRMPRKYELAINMESSRFEENFTVICDLGKGSFGEVKEVMNKNDKKEYAVKILNPAINQEIFDFDMIKEEIQVLSKLENPNIVRYYDAWQEYEEFFEDSESQSFPESTGIEENKNNMSTLRFEEYTTEYEEQESEYDEYSAERNTAASGHNSEEREVDDYMSEGQSTFLCMNNVEGKKEPEIEESYIIYIEMELCEKNTLEELIRHKDPISDDIKWQITIDLLLGLEYIHSQGVIHKDIKPQNIFITDNYKAKYGDFGISYTNDFTEKKLLGTQMYMPKESTIASVYQNKTKDQIFEIYTKRDVYALGITLIQMWGEDLSREIYYNGKSNINSLLSNISNVELRDLLKSMIQEKYMQRPSSSELLKTHIIVQHIEDPDDFVKQYCATFKQQPTDVDKLREMVNILFQRTEVANNENDGVRSNEYIALIQKAFEQKFFGWDTIIDYHQSKNIEFLDEYFKDRYIIHLDLKLLIDIRDIPIVFSILHKIELKPCLYLGILHHEQYPIEVYWQTDSIDEILESIQEKLRRCIKIEEGIKFYIDNQKNKYELQGRNVSTIELKDKQLKSQYIWEGFEVFSFIAECGGKVVAFGGILEDYLQVTYLIE